VLTSAMDAAPAQVAGSAVANACCAPAKSVPGARGACC